jgi:hypothetical protein
MTIQLKEGNDHKNERRINAYNPEENNSEFSKSEISLIDQYDEDMIPS